MQSACVQSMPNTGQTATNTEELMQKAMGHLSSPVCKIAYSVQTYLVPECWLCTGSNPLMYCGLAYPKCRHLHANACAVLPCAAWQ